MRKISLLLLIIAISGLVSCAPIRGSIEPVPKSAMKETSLGLYTILEDTTWEGRIRITGDVYVKEGVTLTIKPGTTIRFDTIEPKLEQDGGRNMLKLDSPYFPGAEIIVRGRIIAVGTKDSPITFTSSDSSPRAGIWGAINLLGSNGNEFKYCRISYAYNGIHNHASQAKITKCIFHDNGTALSFKKADFENPCVMDIEENTIVGNKSGIGARNSEVTVVHNNISDNEFYGIWLREGVSGTIAFNDIADNGKGIYLYKAPPLTISWNNIMDNKEYNIAMAEDNPSDLNAINNWWGATDAAKIEDKFFDKKMDESLGEIIYQPFLNSKVVDTVK